MNEMKSQDLRQDSNHLVGVPSHPLGAGVGALGGAAAGAAVGMAGGPVGAVIGAAFGAVAGGLGGDAVASSFDQVEESNYWRENFSRRPYVQADASFDDFGPAYAFGAGAFDRYRSRGFDEAETDLSVEWDAHRGTSSLDWPRARDASRDAWDRLNERS